MIVGLTDSSLEDEALKDAVGCSVLDRGDLWF